MMATLRSCRRRFNACLLACFIAWLFVIYMVMYRGDGAWKNWSRVESESRHDKTKSRYKYVTEQAQNETCNPQGRLVFVRTHSRDSGILAAILQRYGYSRQLSFMMGSDGDAISNSDIFNRNMLKGMPPPIGRDAKSGGYHILASHVRYNHREVNATLANATHFTLLVEPVQYLLHVFNLYNVDKSLHLTRYNNPLDKFMEKPQAYTDMRFKYWFQMHNGQLFSLGLDHEHHDNPSTVREKIKSLRKELDFVLLGEFFDESLVILRKKLCWHWRDILYLPHFDPLGGAKKKSYLTLPLAASIEEWNMADTMLYSHFNKSLWQEITDYGPSFHEDVQYFQRMRNSSQRECLVNDDTAGLSLRLKEGAPAYCRTLVHSEKVLWQTIRHRQSNMKT